MKNIDKLQLTFKLIATAMCIIQLIVFGPSIGLAICHSFFLHCIWWNKEIN